jgi:hypothetical protein
MTEQVYRRRRETDRAEQRAQRAADRGDHAGYLMAMGQAEAARRRREEWARGTGETPQGQEA